MATFCCVVSIFIGAVNGVVKSRLQGMVRHKAGELESIIWLGALLKALGDCSGSDLSLVVELCFSGGVFGEILWLTRKRGLVTDSQKSILFLSKKEPGIFLWRPGSVARYSGAKALKVAMRYPGLRVLCEIWWCASIRYRCLAGKKEKEVANQNRLGHLLDTLGDFPYKVTYF